MSTKLAQFVTIMLYALVAGVMWGTWVSLSRTMTEYDAETFLADGHHMIANLDPLMMILMIGTAAAVAVTTVVLFRARSIMAGLLAFGALVLLGAVIAVTLIVEVPIDDKIKGWTVDTLPSNWEDIRARWSHFHTLRTFLSLGGLAAMVGAGLTTGAPTGRRRR